MAVNILVTGASGLLGGSLLGVLGAGNHVAGWQRHGNVPGLARVDARQKAEVGRYFAQNRVDVCIHCIAHADVQACERDPRAAYDLNARTTENVAAACVLHGAKLVYISTEYVFDGVSLSGYREDDVPNPLQTYGRTKLLGEQLASGVPERLTVRLPILYGPPIPGRAPGWIETMLQALGGGSAVSLDDRVVRQPTWVRDVAVVLKQVIGRGVTGPLHIASQEGLTKFAWGRKVAETAGLPASLVRPAADAPHPLDINRPARPWLHIDRLHHLGVRAPAGASGRVREHLRSLPPFPKAHLR
jgi:dTDP-4-dehydrorhamnose reductase